MNRLDPITLSEVMLSFQSMSHKKLQKMLYYFTAWYVTCFDEKPCDIEFEAWVHGPVSPEVYQHYKSYGWSDIPQTHSPCSNSSRIHQFAQKVFNYYSCLSAYELEMLSHSEKPWADARIGVESYESSNTTISEAALKGFYQNHEALSYFKN